MRRAVSARSGTIAPIILAGALLIGCGTTGGAGGAGDGGPGDASEGGSSADATRPPPRDATTRDATDGQTLGNTCQSGQACGDGGTCTGGVCCSVAHACGAACCGSGDLCSFGKCVKPGAACVDSTDCTGAEYCQYTVATSAPADAGAGKPDASPTPADAGACVGGVTPPSGVCLPAPPICAGDGGVPDGGGCIEFCKYHPPFGQFTPALAYSWGGEITTPYSTDVMMAPIVLPLEDTNCDGKVNAEDIPDIVFSTFTGGLYTVNGTLHAIAVRHGALVDRWKAAITVDPIAQLAGGDLDGKPGNEVVACLAPTSSGGATGGVAAVRGDGTTLWTTPGTSCFMPALADLDGDGKVEVVTEGGILDGATGALKHSWGGVAGTNIGNFAISDLDGDGVLDVVTAVGAYHADGTRFVTLGPAATSPESSANTVAIGDFDRDGKPEVVVVTYAKHTVSVWHYDSTQAGSFSWVRQSVDINGTLTQHCASGSAGYTAGGGPPTVADFNGDGTPDIALAGGIGYTILDGSKVINAAVPSTGVALWAATTTDCSSAETGSSVFDFKGDGKAEALYSDENHLRVYDGPTGAVLWSTCNTTGTVIEYPLVVDVDVDGHADIVVVSNAYASPYSPEYQCQDTPSGPIAQSGVRVFSDANLSWVRTRSIWNEHGYHVTNVNDDGTIPAHELPNWKQAGLNDYRQNKQPGSEFAAPDAVVTVAASCGVPFSVSVAVRNLGEAALPAGVPVGIYSGTAPAGTKLGATTTLIPLYSAQSETLVVPLPAAPSDVVNGKTPVYAVVDDTTTPHPSWHECNATNNTSPPAAGGCQGPK